MSEDDARWFALDTHLPINLVRARLQALLDEHRARSRWRRAFAGTVDQNPFVLKASSVTKDFSLEGYLNQTDGGTRVVISVAGLRTHPLLQGAALSSVLVFGCVGAWAEGKGHPEWQEATVISTALLLAVIVGWFSNARVTAREAERIRSKLRALLVDCDPDEGLPGMTKDTTSREC